MTRRGRTYSTSKVRFGDARHCTPRVNGPTQWMAPNICETISAQNKHQPFDPTRPITAPFRKRAFTRAEFRNLRVSAHLFPISEGYPITPPVLPQQHLPVAFLVELQTFSRTRSSLDGTGTESQAMPYERPMHVQTTHICMPSARNLSCSPIIQLALRRLTTLTSSLHAKKQIRSGGACGNRVKHHIRPSFISLSLSVCASRRGCSCQTCSQATPGMSQSNTKAILRYTFPHARAAAGAPKYASRYSRMFEKSAPAPRHRSRKGHKRNPAVSRGLDLTGHRVPTIQATEPNCKFGEKGEHARTDTPTTRNVGFIYPESATTYHGLRTEQGRPHTSHHNHSTAPTAFDRSSTLLLVLTEVRVSGFRAA